MPTERLPAIRNLLSRVSIRYPNLTEVFDRYFALLEICYTSEPDDLSPWVGETGDFPLLDIRSLDLDRLPQSQETYRRILEVMGPDAGKLGGGPVMKWSLKPSLTALRKNRSFPSPDAGENRVRCLLCGGLPGFAELPAEGGRNLFCGFCGFRWPVEDEPCLACGDRDRQHKGFFVGEDGGRFGYRAESCESCRTYLKTAHRKLQKEIIDDVDVEDIITLPLDIIADSRGFQALSQYDIPPNRK